MTKVREHFWSWLAGFIDGDGCISVRLGYPNGKTYKPYTKVEIIVSQKYENRKPILLIAKVLNKKPGYQMCEIELKGKKRFVKMISVRLTGYQNIPILELIIPYLVLKKSQAQKALRVLNKMKQ